MTIDLVDRRVVSRETTVVVDPETVPLGHPVNALVHTLLVLLMAALAILVLLPAAVAAASAL